MDHCQYIFNFAAQLLRNLQNQNTGNMICDDSGCYENEIHLFNPNQQATSPAGSGLQLNIITLVTGLLLISMYLSVVSNRYRSQNKPTNSNWRNDNEEIN